MCYKTRFKCVARFDSQCAPIRFACDQYMCIYTERGVVVDGFAHTLHIYNCSLTETHPPPSPDYVPSLPPWLTTFILLRELVFLKCILFDDIIDAVFRDRALSGKKKNIMRYEVTAQSIRTEYGLRFSLSSLSYKYSEKMR